MSWFIDIGRVVSTGGRALSTLINPATATVSAFLSLYEATNNGTNRYDIQPPASLTANRLETKPDASITWPAGAGGVCTPSSLENAQTYLAVKTLGAGGGINLGGAGSLGLTGVFCDTTVATSGGANTTAHGLGRAPTVFGAIILDNNHASNNINISAVSANATNVLWTDSAAGGNAMVFAL